MLSQFLRLLIALYSKSMSYFLLLCIYKTVKLRLSANLRQHCAVGTALRHFDRIQSIETPMPAAKHLHLWQFRKIPRQIRKHLLRLLTIVVTELKLLRVVDHPLLRCVYASAWNAFFELTPEVLDAVYVGIAVNVLSSVVVNRSVRVTVVLAKQILLDSDVAGVPISVDRWFPALPCPWWRFGVCCV